MILYLIGHTKFGGKAVSMGIFVIQLFLFSYRIEKTKRKKEKGHRWISTFNQDLHKSIGKRERLIGVIGWLALKCL